MRKFFLTPLKDIFLESGNVKHALKSSEESFESFGEAYFSEVKFRNVKGWKKHTRMTLNLIVPVGNVRFVIVDDTNNAVPEISEVIIGESNYQRLTVPAGYWVAFQGLTEGKNLILNIASIEHDPNEAMKEDLSHFHFDWKNLNG